MKYFSSEINGKVISDFQQYDTSLTKYGDRLGLVNSMINNENETLHDFFIIYFGEYYNSRPNQNGWLSEQDAVCKTIESLGTYLLNSKDIDSNRKIEYRFWKSEREFKQYKESKNVNLSTLESGMDDGVEVIDLFFTHDDKNFKLSTNPRLYSKDVKEIKEIGILQKCIETAKDESFARSIENRIDTILPIIEDEKVKTRLKNIRRNVKNYVNQWIRDMKENQIAIKTAVRRPIQFKNSLPDSGVLDKLDVIDFMEKKDVELFLPFISSEDLMTDIGILAYDLNQLLDETRLSNKETEIIGLLRNGYSLKEVREKLDMKRQNVKTYIGRIAGKVVKTYEIQLSEFRDQERQKKLK